jgi:hypothetical protein
MTPNEYWPSSVAFEHVKSSAQAAPLSAGKAIVAASIPPESQLFMFVSLALVPGIAGLAPPIAV